MLRARRSLVLLFGSLLVAMLASGLPAAGNEREDRLIQLKKQFDAQRDAGRLDDAVQTGRQLLALADEILPQDSQITATILNDWALVCGETRNHRDAQAAFQRALAIIEKSDGQECTAGGGRPFQSGSRVRQFGPG